MESRYLFRGRRTDIGDWVEGYFYHEEFYGEIITQELKTVHICDINTIGQCTGIKDKNGRLIFEGDIIQTIALSNDHYQKGAINRVVVKSFCGNLCLCEKENKSGTPIYPFIIDHTLEIIGNVYEDSELLDSFHT